MWGEGSSSGITRGGGGGQGRVGRGSWREVDPQAQLAGESRVERMQRWKEEQRRFKMMEVSGGGGGGGGGAVEGSGRESSSPLSSPPVPVKT